MTQETWTAVDRYITDSLLPADAALEAALEDSAAADLPAINVSPPQGKLLFLLARLHHARSILEIGTLGGYSSIWLARGLEAGGRLVTLERDPGYAAVARANIARAGLSSVVDLRVGLAIDALPALEAEHREPFDLVFIDADKAGNPDYFTWALRLTRPGSLIIVDNVVREGRVLAEASEDPQILGVRRLYEMIASEPRVTATAIQTVGGKGHDGLAMILVIGR